MFKPPWDLIWVYDLWKSNAKVPLESKTILKFNNLFLGPLSTFPESVINLFTTFWVILFKNQTAGYHIILVKMAMVICWKEKSLVKQQKFKDDTVKKVLCLFFQPAQWIIQADSFRPEGAEDCLQVRHFHIVHLSVACSSVDLLVYFVTKEMQIKWVLFLDLQNAEKCWKKVTLWLKQCYPI